MPDARLAETSDVDAITQLTIGRALRGVDRPRLLDQVARQRRRILLAYAVLAAGAIVVYHVVQSVNARSLIYEGVGASCVAAIVTGVRWHRPERRSAWYLIAASQALRVAGDVIWWWYPVVTHRQLPYPSAADALHLLGYPLLVAGLYRLIRGRDRHPRDGWVDASIVVGALGWLLWQLVLDMYPGNVHVTGDYVNLAYPVVDLFLVTMLARVMFAPGRRPRAFALLTVGLMFVLVSDVVYARIVVVGPWEWGNTLTTGWLLGYALLGAAALHPSMAAIGRPSDQLHLRMTVARLGILVGFASVPALGFYVGEAFGVDMHPSVTIAMILAIILLGAARMAGLMRDNEIQTRSLAMAQHERGLLLERVTGAGERERVHLAAELHDGPIQHLTSLRFRLDRATARLQAGEVDLAHELVNRVGDDVTGEIGVLPKIIAELRPPILSQRGLGPALDDYAASLGGETSQRIVVAADVPEALDDETEIALYRIAQEGMTNAVRHSGGTRVDVCLQRHRQQIDLEVRDDGCGFAPEERRDDAATHFGLIAMRERALMHGGTFRVETAPGRGTAVLVTIPLFGREA